MSNDKPVNLALLQPPVLPTKWRDRRREPALAPMSFNDALEDFAKYVYVDRFFKGLDVTNSMPDRVFCDLVGDEKIFKDVFAHSIKYSQRACEDLSYDAYIPKELFSGEVDHRLGSITIKYLTGDIGWMDEESCAAAAEDYDRLSRQYSEGIIKNTDLLGLTLSGLYYYANSYTYRFMIPGLSSICMAMYHHVNDAMGFGNQPIPKPYTRVWKHWGETAQKWCTKTEQFKRCMGTELCQRFVIGRMSIEVKTYPMNYDVSTLAMIAKNLGQPYVPD